MGGFRAKGRMAKKIQATIVRWGYIRKIGKKGTRIPKCACTEAPLDVRIGPVGTRLGGLSKWEMLRLRIPKCVITEAPIHVRISPIGNALGGG